jgi:hypothetical protein
MGVLVKYVAETRRRVYSGKLSAVSATLHVHPDTPQISIIQWAISMLLVFEATAPHGNTSPILLNSEIA